MCVSIYVRMEFEGEERKKGRRGRRGGEEEGEERKKVRRGRRGGEEEGEERKKGRRGRRGRGTYCHCWEFKDYVYYTYKDIWHRVL